MSEPPDARVMQIAEAIRGYLARHPDAADSEDGIAAWWMPEMGLETTAAEVGDALAALTRARVIDQQRLPDGRVIYRRHGSPGCAIRRCTGN